MSKHSTNLLLTIYVALAVSIAGSLAAMDSYALPIMYAKSPFLLELHKRYPYIIDIFVDLIEISAGVFIALKAPFLEVRLKRILQRRSALFDVIESSEFATDTGLTFIDIDGRILCTTKFMIALAENKRSEVIIGTCYQHLYSENLTRLFNELIEKAKYSRALAAKEIDDWTEYTTKPMGAAILYFTPSYHNGEYIGGIIVIRSTADVRTAENSSIFYQMHYNILFDTLPIGVAVFRPSIAPDGGADGYMLTANPALRKIVDGIPLPVNEPCSVVWPSFLHQKKLRDSISAALSSGAAARCEFFSPALGKHLEVYIAQLPGGRSICMLLDHTELRINEQKVLGLSDQLQRTVQTQALYLARVLEDIQNFNQATADMVEMYLDVLKQLAPTLTEESADIITEAAGGLYKCLNQMLRYHNVPHLPFKETTLIHPAEVVTRLLEPLGNRFPHVAFTVGSLPGVVSNREILSNIIEMLMVSLAGLPVETPPGRIDVSSQRDFLTTKITVSGWGFDTSPTFLETPAERQYLDWMLTSDLDLATVRRMVAKHGGDIYIGPTPDGDGIELSFSIGSPTAA